MTEELINRIAQAIERLRPLEFHSSEEIAQVALTAMDDVRSHDAEDDAYRRGYDYGRQKAAEEFDRLLQEFLISGAKEASLDKIISQVRALPLEK